MRIERTSCALEKSPSSTRMFGMGDGEKLRKERVQLSIPEKASKLTIIIKRPF